MVTSNSSSFRQLFTSTYRYGAVVVVPIDEATERRTGMSNNSNNNEHLIKKDIQNDVLFTTSNDNGNTQEQQEQQQQLVTEIVNMMGNMLEWYAFASFGYLSDVLGRIFFPSDVSENNTALIESFAVFGSAFLMRPIGGLWFGHLGDTYGRKIALETSLLLMAISSIAMGCLPTYQHIGRYSYALLILFRLGQGLSGGGQLMSSLVFTVEGRPNNEWGLHGSFVMAAANTGNLLSGVTVYSIRLFIRDDSRLHSYGWRIPFVLSGLLLFICWFYLRYVCHERNDQQEMYTSSSSSNMNSINPIIQALAPENRQSLLAACMVPILWSAGFWVTFVWMAIFEYELIPNPIPQAFGINGLATFLGVCLLFPVAGALSDKFDRRLIMTVGGLVYGLGSPVFVLLIGTGVPFLAFISQLTLGISLSLWGAPMMAWLAESFDPEIRLTCTAVGYNLGVGIMAGISPAVETYLVETFSYRFAGFWMTLLAVISLIGLWFVAPIKPTKKDCSSSHETLPFTDDEENTST